MSWADARKPAPVRREPMPREPMCTLKEQQQREMVWANEVRSMEEALQLTIRHVHQADAEKEHLRDQLLLIRDAVQQLLDGAAVLDPESRSTLLRVLQIAKQADGSLGEMPDVVPPPPGKPPPVSQGLSPDARCRTSEGMAEQKYPSSQRQEQQLPENTLDGGTGGSASPLGAVVAIAAVTSVAAEERADSAAEAAEWELVKPAVEEPEEEQEEGLLFRARAVVMELLDIVRGLD